jgi:hypothetical protein
LVKIEELPTAVQILNRTAGSHETAAEENREQPIFHYGKDAIRAKQQSI